MNLSIPQLQGTHPPTPALLPSLLSLLERDSDCRACLLGWCPLQGVLGQAWPATGSEAEHQELVLLLPGGSCVSSAPVRRPGGCAAEPGCRDQVGVPVSGPLLGSRWGGGAQCSMSPRHFTPRGFCLTPNQLQGFVASVSAG